MIAIRYTVTLAIMSAMLALASPASARSSGIKYAPNYSDLRGFNYNPISAQNGDDKWNHFNHAEVDHDFSYAERLKLNSVRIVPLLQGLASGSRGL
jgi:hypothetical protein